MKNEDIKKRILHEDDCSPYLVEIQHRFFRHQKSLSTADRLVYPMADPAFGIHYIRAYLRVDAWLPNEVWWPSMWRAFCALRYDQELRDKDPNVFEALALGHPANRAKQLQIKALLCACLTYEKVGRLVGISTDVIEVYAHLFFDFAERQDDQSFVLKVLNPRVQLRVARAEEDKAQDTASLLMNIGYQLGPEAVIKVLGLNVEWRNPGQEGQGVNNIKHALLSAGEIKARLGLLLSSDPEFALVKTLIAEDAKYHPDALDDDWRMGLGAMSMDESAQSLLKAVMMTAADERLRAAQIFDLSIADEYRKLAEKSAKEKPPQV